MSQPCFNYFFCSELLGYVPDVSPFSQLNTWNVDIMANITTIAINNQNKNMQTKPEENPSTRKETHAKMQKQEGVATVKTQR